MATNDQGSCGAASADQDRIDKVFVALGQGMRRCLVCDGVLTPQGAAEHAEVALLPSCSLRVIHLDE